MAGETSEHGPSDQEVRMVAFKRKFDELLNFVQLMARRNLDGENQRKEDDRNANNEEPEGHSNTNTTPPPQTPPKPEEKTPNIPRHPDWARGRMVLTIEKDLSLEGTGRYLPGSIQVQLSNSSGSVRSSEDGEKEQRNLQGGYNMQFCVDLIPAGERIEDALKTKKIVDMTALMALAEQAAKKAPTKKKEGDVQMIGRSNGIPRQVLPTFHHANRYNLGRLQFPAPTQVPASGPNTPDAGKGQWETNSMTIREEPNLACCPETLQQPAKERFQPKFDLRFPLWRSGTRSGELQPTEASGSRPNDHGILKFDGLPNITTNPCPIIQREV
uniref:Uncharacterized protein n=1 Tax=Fagus sylvatica TaxID=28930 RepID=A0A2N9FJW1_FAGSY